MSCLEKQNQPKQLRVITSDFNNNFNNDIRHRYYRNLSLVDQKTFKEGNKALEESKKENLDN